MTEHVCGIPFPRAGLAVLLLAALVVADNLAASEPEGRSRPEPGDVWRISFRDALGRPREVRLVPPTGNPRTEIGFRKILRHDLAGRQGAWRVFALLKTDAPPSDWPLLRIFHKSALGQAFRVVSADAFPDRKGFHPVEVPELGWVDTMGPNVALTRLMPDVHVWIEGLELRYESLLTDRELADAKGLGEPVPALPKPGRDRFRVLCHLGLYWPTFRIVEATDAAGAARIERYVIKGKEGCPQIAGGSRAQPIHRHLEAAKVKSLAGVGSKDLAAFASHLDDAEPAGDGLEDASLYGTALIVNVRAHAFSLEERLMLRAFVEAGGTLVVLAGPSNLREGYPDGTALGAMLPVKPRKRLRRWTRAGDPESGLPLRPEPEDALAAGLPWDADPRVWYLYDFVPTEDAAVHVRAGEAPILLSRTVGKGRCFLWLGLPLEDAETRKGLAFWEWKGWTGLLARMLRHGRPEAEER